MDIGQRTKCNIKKNSNTKTFSMIFYVSNQKLGELCVFEILQVLL